MVTMMMMTKYLQVLQLFQSSKNSARNTRQLISLQIAKRYRFVNAQVRRSLIVFLLRLFNL